MTDFYDENLKVLNFTHIDFDGVASAIVLKNFYKNVIVEKINYGGEKEIIADGIVVNLYSDNLMISPRNVLSMKEHKEYLNTGHVSHVVQKETKVTLGTPADFPEEMAEAAAKYARSNSNINAFWLKLMTSEEEQSFLMVVDFTGDREAVLNGLGNAASPYVPKGFYLDMIPCTDSLGRQAATGEPYYRRQ